LLKVRVSINKKTILLTLHGIYLFAKNNAILREINQMITILTIKIKQGGEEMLPDQQAETEEGRIPQRRSPRTDLMAVKAYMEQHYHEPLTIGQLAQMANISPKYFVDLFKKTFGRSAMDYLTDLRINRAKRYLSESGERLRDIALKVGYNDEFYFSRKFKKEVGVSPSAFVRNPRQRIAACSGSIIGQLLALQIIPAAAPLDSKWTAHYYSSYRTQIQVHLDMVEPYTEYKFEANLDKLAQVRPDAIIGTEQLSASNKERLMNIAPAFFASTGSTGWREQLMQIASFLDREDMAVRWIEGYDQKVRVARKLIRQVVGEDTVLVLRLYGQGLHMYCNRGLEDVLYQDLQLRAVCTEPHRRCTPLTMEQLAELMPDRILLMVCPESRSRAYWLALQHSKAWRQLKAVRNGDVYLLPSDPWFEYSAMSIGRMLDESLLLFTGNAADGLMDSVINRSNS
jgi:AraC family transcriptional regulator, transcriptional activator for feuABC-ybbA operon